MLYFHNNTLFCFQHFWHFEPFYPGFYMSSTLPDPMTNGSPSTYFSWIVSPILMSFILLYTEGHNYLDQGSASCGLQAGFNLLLVFVNENLMKHNHACLFCSWLLLCYKGMVEQLQPRTYGLQRWKYYLTIVTTTTKANIWPTL